MSIKVAYLFGAGASQGELNLSGGLQSILMDSIAEDIAIKMREMGESIFDDVSNDLITGVNIEHLITLYESSGSRLHSQIATKLKTLFRKEIQDRIRKLGGKFIPSVLSALIDMYSVDGLGEELGLLLTTNYEDLLERAVQEVKGGVNYVIKTNSEGSYLSTSEAAIPILKLHGSFNWKNDYPIAIESDIEEEEDIIWIPPGVVKRRQYYPFDVIWGKARELLECQVLRIIGCSLSTSDWELISLLFTTQRQGTEQTPQYEIELIDYPEHCSKVQQRYGYLRDIKTILEIQEVREFLVKTYLPNYIGQKDIPEERINGIAKHINNQNIFELWLRSKGEHLYDNGASLETEKGYFKKFILSGLGYGEA